MIPDFSVFLSLLNNISIFIVLIAGYGFFRDSLGKKMNPRVFDVLLGVFFGLVTIGAMHIIIPVHEGVRVDQRNAIVVLAGAFGGPIVAAVNVIFAAGFRIYLGGAGTVAGVTGVFLAAGAGLILYKMRRRDDGALRIAIGSVLAVVAIIPGFLLVGDLATGWELLKRMIVPWGGAMFVGLFLGGLMLTREDRRISETKNRKRAEQARDLALRDAERANEAKSEFLATMSHEFRTPLNAILGFSDILRNQEFGPAGKDKYKEYASDIYSSGELLMELVNDLLDVSTIEAGKKSLNIASVDTRELVRGCLKIVAHKAEKHGVELVDNVTESNLSLLADKRALQQVILNLLSNAIKYTPKGGRVSVNANLSDQGAEIIVADTGVGIPDDRMNDILNPFVRTESDPHKAQEGWGLGLSIARSLVELHGGALSINSKIDEGTTVRVSIPNPL